MATASGTQHGYILSLPLLTGISVALASMSAFASVGLASLLLALPNLQWGIKLLGSLYLLYLAWRVGSSGAPQQRDSKALPRGWLSGVGLLWLNPKAWAMTMGAAASFGGASPIDDAILLATAFGLGSALSLSIWCAAGMLLARFLSTEKQWRVLNLSLAVLLTASLVPIWLS